MKSLARHKKGLAAAKLCDYDVMRVLNAIPSQFEHKKTACHFKGVHYLFEGVLRTKGWFIYSRVRSRD